MAYQFGQMHNYGGYTPTMQAALGYGYGPEKITSPMPDQKALLTSRFAADPPKKADTSKSSEEVLASVLSAALGLGIPAVKLLMKTGALDGVLGNLFGGQITGGAGQDALISGSGDDLLDSIPNIPGGSEIVGALTGPSAGGAAAGAGALDVGIGPGSAAFEAASVGAGPELAPALGLDLGGGELVTGGAGEAALEGGGLTDFLGIGGEGGASLLNPGPGGLFSGSLSATSGGIGGALGGLLSAGAYAALPAALFYGLSQIPNSEGFKSEGGGTADLANGYQHGAGKSAEYLSDAFLGDKSWLEGRDPAGLRFNLDSGFHSGDKSATYHSIGGPQYRTVDQAVDSGRQMARGALGLPVEYEPLHGGILGDADFVRMLQNKALPTFDAPGTGLPDDWSLWQDRAAESRSGGEGGAWAPSTIDAYRGALGSDRAREWFDTGLGANHMWAYTVNPYQYLGGA